MTSSSIRQNLKQVVNLEIINIMTKGAHKIIAFLTETFPQSQICFCFCFFTTINIYALEKKGLKWMIVKENKLV